MNKKELRAIDEHVGRQLRSVRLSRGLSQEQLATQIDLTFQQLQKYERGANRISASRLFQLSQILEIKPAFFFNGLLESSEEPFPALKKEHFNLINYYDSVPKLQRRGFLELLKSLSEGKKS